MNAPITTPERETIDPPIEDSDSGLCDVLKAATAESHSAIDQSLTVRAFLRGCFTPETYLQMMADLRGVYGVLERALSRSSPPDDPVVQCFNPLVTNRSLRISEDLESISTRFSKPIPELSAAGQAYVRHLDELSTNESDPGIIGHVYARYLGDLHGGQVLGRIVTRALRLPPGVGVQFYDFTDRDHLPDLRADFRKQIDNAGKHLQGSERDRVVHESLVSFDLSYRILASSNGSFIRTFLRLITPRLSRDPA